MHDDRLALQEAELAVLATRATICEDELAGRIQYPLTGKPYVGKHWQGDIDREKANA